MPKQVTVILARMVRQTRTIGVEVPDSFPLPLGETTGGAPEYDELLRLAWDHREDRLDAKWDDDQVWGDDEATHVLLPPNKQALQPEFRLTGRDPAHYRMTPTIKKG